MRAGVEVNLLPGFEVEAGGEFLAYIKPFECNNHAYIRNARAEEFISDTVEVIDSIMSNNEVNQTEVIVFPNPSSGIFTIKFPNEREEDFHAEIEIFSAYGKPIRREIILSSFGKKFDLSEEAKRGLSIKN